MSARLVWRGRLASRWGALLQVILIAIGALALPSDEWLSPLLLAVLAAILLWLAGDDWRLAGFGRPGRRTVWWLVIAVAVGGLWQYAAVGVVAPLTAQRLNSLASVSPVPAGPLGLLLSFAGFVVLQPLAKGLAYRGLLLARLERMFGQTVLGVAASLLLASMVFGFSDWKQGSAAVVVGVLTGAVFNALYYWADLSVWPSVLAHAVYNGVAVTLLYLPLFM